MPSPEACADETDRELRAEIERLRACLRERDKLNLEFQAEIDRLRGVIRSAYEDMSVRDDAGAYMTLKHEREKLDTREHS